MLFLMVLIISACTEETSPKPQETSAKTQTMIGYKITPNVTYGQGDVVRDGETFSRDLWMDVYEPVEKAEEPRPAVIMTFGGSFHRGGPRFTFEVDGAQDTSMGDYCRKLASLGYVCFAIDYRLATELPVLSMTGYSEADLDMKSFETVIPQVNHVRQSMGLSILDPKKPEDIQFARDFVLSAAEDLNNAVTFVRNSAQQYNIDPDRIVLGGFSAGAITSWNVAQGMDAPVAGVFTLSGASVGFDITKVLTADSPPSLLFLGEYDLAQAQEALGQLLQEYKKANAPYTFAWVPGFGHFYPAGAPSLSGNATKMSVERRIVEFLEQTVGK